VLISGINYSFRWQSLVISYHELAAMVRLTLYFTNRRIGSRSRAAFGLAVVAFVGSDALVGSGSCLGFSFRLREAIRLG